MSWNLIESKEKPASPETLNVNLHRKPVLDSGVSHKQHTVYGLGVKVQGSGLTGVPRI
jgi:hypothetical protein